MVMDRARWTLFQLAIAGLQRNYVMQIWLVVLVDAVYLVTVIRQSWGKRIFRTGGLKIKHIAQEAAIFIFILILGIFSFVQNTAFTSTGFYTVLQAVIVVAVIVAIASEVVALVWNIVSKIAEFLADRRSNKQREITEKVSKMEKESRGMIESEPINTNKRPAETDSAM
jgi:hypothetical protein